MQLKFCENWAHVKGADTFSDIPFNEKPYCGQIQPAKIGTPESRSKPLPRPVRLKLPGIPQHIMQRGNNRQPCFFATADYELYLRLLTGACKNHQCDLHAFVLMTNHVHLLITPHECWLALGTDNSGCLSAYLSMFEQEPDPRQIEDIRYGLRKGLPTKKSRVLSFPIPSTQM